MSAGAHNGDLAPIPPGYRPDIDGLRAVAVILVIFFHYGLPGATGGFIGVDVFFVISGYLITGKLVEARGPRGGTALLRWLGDFYRRRILRIAPAMLVMLLLVMAAGWFVLAPGDYAALGRSAAYSAVGLANLFFYKNTGYFDAAADTMPLLHMWSLAVEEQFYLVWPPVLATVLALTASRPARARWLMLALVAIGFAISVFLLFRNPKAAFFLPFGRGWELALGALLVFVTPIASRYLAELGVIAGLGLIVGSAIMLTAADPFPGLNALAPCLGAALIVCPRSAGSVTARLLGARPWRAIGRVSYSLYLWHWPVLVLFRHYINGAWPSPAELAALGAASLVLAILSWRYVEEPFRRLRSPLLPVSLGWCGSVAAVAMVGLAVFWSKGVSSRLPPAFAGLYSLDEMWEWPCEVRAIPGLPSAYCSFGRPSDEPGPRAMLWGDSHAEHMAAILEPAAAGDGVSYLLYRACIASFGGKVRAELGSMSDYDSYCRDGRSAGLAYLRGHPEVSLVVLVGAWRKSASLASARTGPPRNHDSALIGEGLEEFLELAVAPGRRFLIIADTPSTEADPIPCVLAEGSGLLRRPCPPGQPGITRAAFEEYVRDLNDRFAAIVARRDDTAVLDPGTGLCASGDCLMYLNGEFLYRDQQHYRRNLSPETRRALAALMGLVEAVHDGLAKAAGTYRPAP